MRQVLWMAILAGSVVTILGVLSAQALRLIGVVEVTRTLVTLFSLWIVLATTSSAQRGIMIWQHKLRSSAFCEIAGELVGLVVSLATLVQGLGVFALAWGRLAKQVVHLGLSFAITRLLPMRGMSEEQRRDLRDYSVQIFASNMIINLRLYAATFIVGGFLGAAAVGYDRAAERLVGVVSEVVSVPAQVLAWSLFRRARDRHDGTTEGFQHQAQSYFHVLFLASVPVFIWVSVCTQDLIVGLLGQEWLPAAPIVVILALSRLLIIPGAANAPLLSLAGEIRRLPKFAVLFLVVNVVVTVAVGPLGIVALAWSQVFVSAFILICMTRLTHAYAAITWREIFYRARYIIVPVLIASALLIYLQHSDLLAGLTPLVRVLLSSVPVLIVYVIALCVLDPFVREYVRARLASAQTSDQGATE
ncbi:oligosaccharide flippase family protein [Falsihalocynthiibacter sp. SS001]|uniref:oligosaccharide flippase family protein n=1 Tax=Falsihalocynthiibacter sp. SS001 TaxID=3349698 RepID=UPI0036D284E4